MRREGVEFQAPIRGYFTLALSILWTVPSCNSGLFFEGHFSLSHAKHRQDLTELNATDSTHTIGPKDWLYLLKGVNLVFVSGSMLFHFCMADRTHAPGHVQVWTLRNQNHPNDAFKERVPGPKMVIADWWLRASMGPIDNSWKKNHTTKGLLGL